ncbi:hypothetical protein J5N97_001935 [Dioscorea zingiberensis]|uniref:Isopenicillin N synthase-like Fe(2+) 2OG dioxygenase domain-containing protein n=1 Tax=Dioscorea zingiberensis TaxID=325984 RepID=A0A9D5BTI8_9LILI|nr:hypothetical protein J5N97_001935 [Dioscorea zingiberensis]
MPPTMASTGVKECVGEEYVLGTVILSNGVYKSMEHRAMVNSEQERISIAMFFNPKFEAEIGPVTSLITPENPPLFKRIGMEQYVQDFYTRRKLDGKSYLDQNEAPEWELSNTNAVLHA